MTLSKLPSIITNTEFDKDGFAVIGNKRFVPAYIASELGFNVPGRYFLNNEFYPKLKESGILPLCPFTACGEYLDLETITNDEIKVKELKQAWRKFNSLIGEVNYQTLMPRSKFMIAIYDGSNASDDGVSAETGYFAAKHGLIVGIRSDFRLAENIEAAINPAVRYFVDQDLFKGKFFTGPDAYDNAYEEIKHIANTMLMEG